ncbi:MAG TPA: ABC transporter substrate-binding protein [Acidimicrobiales bacterium]
MSNARPAWGRVHHVVLAVALLAALVSCGGKKAGTIQKPITGGVKADAVETGLATAGKPQRGGILKYGLEAESSGGYCLPEAQLAISGIQVARAIYDTLLTVNAAGKVVPDLATSVTHNGTYTKWTINVRSGVRFHDGSPLTAQVVKNNLDAARGTYPGRKPLLAMFVYQDITGISVTGPLQVTVTTKVPWVAFASYLAGPRFGVMAQAQLDDKKTCDRKPIGTGPFEFVSWKVGSVLKVKRNPHYWQVAPDGKPYPYLDGIDFYPIPDTSVRLNALQSGEIQAMHTSDATTEVEQLGPLQKKGKINLIVSAKDAEVTYLMLNASRAPFNDPSMRRATAIGTSRQQMNQIANDGFPPIDDGPFPPGTLGYLKDPGFPKVNVAEARRLVQAYEKKHGKGSANWTLTLPNDPPTVRIGELIQEASKKVGIKVNLNEEDQAKLINDAIGGKYQAVTFRNHGGNEPDGQYVWWYSTSPVNFGRIKDPIIDRDLDEGRSEPDPAKRNAIYQDLNREFAKQDWNVWSWAALWGVAERPNVHGVLGPNLPDGSKPSKELYNGHSVLGMWMSKS